MKKLKHGLIALAGILAVAAAGGAGVTEPAFAQTSQDALPGVVKALTKSRPLSQRDASAGLKEALSVAATQVTTRLGREGGFFNDPRVRIPLPGLLGRAQKSLQPLGMSGPLDDLQLRVNRGAEAAMPQAKQLLIDAVRGMTVQDAVSIVRGPPDAATQYLRQKSEAQLTGLLRPKMELALTQAGAFTALDTASARAGVNGAAASQSLRNDLINFAVGKALDGAFGYMADEEMAIRQDPARRTSDLLRRVFGVS